MYRNIFIEDKYSPDAKVWLWDDEDGLSTFPYESYCYVIDPSGRYRTLYGQPASRRRYVSKSERASLREEYGTHDVTFESDVRPETRVLVDEYTDDETPSTGHRRLFFDIEVAMKPSLPDPKTALNTVTSVAMYDDQDERKIVFMLGDAPESFEADGTEIITVESERVLLIKFLERWREVNPTLVIGYNSDRFDIPYIYRRLKRVLGEEAANGLSEIGKIDHNERSDMFTIAGCSSMDYIKLYKTFTFSEMASYSLDNVAKEELGRGKIEYEGRRYVRDGDGYAPAGDDALGDDVRVVRDLDDLRACDPALFAEYNMIDVMLLVDMDDKLEFVDLARTICHLGRVPYEDIHLSSRYIDGAILARLKQNGIVAPDRKDYSLDLAEDSPAGADTLRMTRDIPEYIPYKGTLRVWKTQSSNEEIEYVSRQGDTFHLKKGLPIDVSDDMRVTLHYDGAYVKDPVPGRYEWIYDLDLTSMYPSIMMSLNISPETKVGRVFDWDAKRAASGDAPDEYEVWLHSGNRRMHVPASKLHDMLREKELSIAANGVFYRNDRRGVIPDILEEWYASRSHYKTLRNEERHSDEDGSSKRAEYYDKQQHVRKILINCFTPDHEIMTARGPVPVSEVEEGDMAYSINPDTMEVELRPVTRTYAQAYEGDTVEIKSTYVDLKVTPNHRMLTSKQRGDSFQPYEWREAGDLMKDKRRHRLPPRNAEVAEVGKLTRDRIYMQEVCMSRGIVDVMFENGGFRSRQKKAKLQPAGFDMADWAEFCGWYISEGSLVKTERKTFESGNTRGESYNTFITQYPGEHRDRIKALLDRMGFSYKLNGNDLRIASKPLYKILEHDFGKGSYNKTIPDWMFGLPQSALNRLFDAMMAGDGDADGSRYTAVSRRLAGQFIRLSHLVGRPGHLADTADDAYRIGLPHKMGKTPTVKAEHRNVVDYKGMICCVEVEGNHTVLAGRNGKFNWVGQSVYGVSGLPTFRYYDIDNAEAITLTGQALIRFSQEMGNRYYNTRIDGEDRDWCTYIDTDSVFFPATPIVEAERPETDTSDETQMTGAILEITDDVQAYINRSYDTFADRLCAIPDTHEFALTGKSHHFDIKQEMIARSALWIVKKRYAQWIINDEGEPATDLEGTKWDTSADGVPAGEHDVKGLDIIRSDFPECFREHLEDVTYGVLHFEERERLDQAILDFRETVYDRPLEQIANPTSVNKMRKYATDKIGRRKKYTPVHVSAAMAYNELLEVYGLDDDVAPITSGDKIRWVYLDRNPLGFEKVGFKGYGEDPDRVMDFIREHVSHKVMYEKGLERKIQKVYGAMGWSIPSQAAHTLNQFL